MAIKYIRISPLPKNAKTVFLRLDFNTEDEWRMKATIPTIKFLLKKGLKIIIGSHRGRPKGFERALSLRHDAEVLSRLLRRSVEFIPHFRFAEIRLRVEASKPGTIFLLENLRFLPGEEKNDSRFAKTLASLADFYVNDAFPVSHRANASVTAITRFLPSYGGFELEKEVTFFAKARNPQKPLIIILGGAKAHDKLGVLKYFKKKAKYFLLGGAPANTILYLRGVDVKQSKRDTDLRDVRELKTILTYKNVVLPDDFVFYKKAIVDVGNRTMKNFTAKIKSARTIIWSGPLGLIEKKPFDRSTLALARAIIANRKAFSFTGGGETVMFLKKHGLDKRFSFISSGGTAMIDYLAGENLPGIVALDKR